MLKKAKDRWYCENEWSQIVSGEIPTNYNEDVTHWTPIYDWILPRCIPNGHILDVGCGLGHLLKMASDRGHKTTGVDFSEVAIEAAKKRSPLSNFSRHNIEEDTSFLNFEYDTVCFTEVLEHLFNDKKPLREIPIGKEVFISVPIGPLSTGPTSHVRGYKSLDEAVKRYGKIIHIIESEVITEFNFICIHGKTIQNEN